MVWTDYKLRIRQTRVKLKSLIDTTGKPKYQVILEMIELEPGLAFGQLVRKTDYPVGTVSSALHRLMGEGKIIKKQQDGKKRFYPSSYGASTVSTSVTGVTNAAIPPGSGYYIYRPDKKHYTNGPRKQTVADKILAFMQPGQRYTADQVADGIGNVAKNIRPRLYELRQMGRITKLFTDGAPKFELVSQPIIQPTTQVDPEPTQTVPKPPQGFNARQLAKDFMWDTGQYSQELKMFVEWCEQENREISHDL